LFGVFFYFGGQVGGLLQCYKSTAKMPDVDMIAPFVSFTLEVFGYERSFFEANWLEQKTLGFFGEVEARQSHCCILLPFL
jgi:hypothetical protein